ncbi:hypothetical protein BABINDRAFT_159916 [Babjeviella inositovora NRRL Y-12698]|uniref:Guanine deaminase n=1 Tax=Babjeviella inositovora NRRL Y-12698 TaxID=984486 RepID=A0A1E3QVG3_9ASCO|nr:uncharacterized protein BABINDRAFT_159916 [Babjeviella inositovora NRRL Y-12698]ODQ81655.1 hypothetical protein BABINDRAFT_159916 [Babjeviella inositovora NRRL Y-12698]
MTFPRSTDIAAYAASNFTVYRGDMIHTPRLGTLEVIENACVGVDHDGTIRFVSTGENYVEEAQKFNAALKVDTISVCELGAKTGSFFFPGFIDTHIHAPQYPNAGIFGESTLLNWLTTYTFPMESSIKDLKLANVVYNKVLNKTLANGTTLAAYYATLDPDATNLLADLCLQKGQRALIGRVCMDSNSPDYYVETLEQSKKSTTQVIAHVEQRDPLGELVQPILTPRFAPSCSSDLMHWLGELREAKDMLCQTHISENAGEIQWVKGLFPESDSYAGVYDDHKLLSDKTILAHAIHLSDAEKDIIATRGCGIAHCPISNSSITSGEARVRWLLNSKIPVGLGTDISGGYSPSILSTARQALLVSRHLAMKSLQDNDKLTVNEVLYLATMGGAKVCSMENKVGSFEVGKKWDAQLVDLNVENSPVDLFEWQVPQNSSVVGNFPTATKFENMVAKWLFNGDDRNTVSVWVNGRNVVNKIC